jgi:hypothetical protein
VEVRAGAQPGGAAEAEAVAGADRLAGQDIDAGEVGVEGSPAARVGEFDGPAEDRVIGADVDDDAGCGRADGRALRRADIDAGVAAGVLGDGGGPE